MAKRKGKYKKQNKVRPKFTTQNTMTGSIDQPKEGQVSKDGSNGNGDSERHKVEISDT